MREYERKALRVRGWITGLGPGLTPCIVEDISEGGAQLIVDNLKTPDSFRLYFAPGAANYRQCHVRWRKAGSIGVEFTGMYRFATGAGVDSLKLSPDPDAT